MPCDVIFLSFFFPPYFQFIFSVYRLPWFGETKRIQHLPNTNFKKFAKFVGAGSNVSGNPALNPTFHPISCKVRDRYSPAQL